MKKLALLILLSATPALADDVTFDNVAAPGIYIAATPTAYSFGGSTFSGGVVLNTAVWGGISPASNVYATSDFLPLADNSLLAGSISISFDSAADFVSLDVLNVMDAATFFMNVYDVNNNLIGSTSLTLAAFGTPGSVGTMSFTGSGIMSVTITTDQPAGTIDFAIDNVDPIHPPVPEPGSLLLMGSGLVCVGGFLRRKLVR